MLPESNGAGVVRPEEQQKIERVYRITPNVAAR